jgi:RNA polymerase sigma factor (sigma-70 family)
MAHGRSEAVLRYLRQVVRSARGEAGTDEQLLQRFTARRDEDAFALLVERHGPMVWGACRRLLPQAADAEDAFQATFLVLARKAGAIRRPERLANWLYGVACRTAAKARVAAAKRRSHEKPLAVEPAVEPVDEVLWRDVRTILDEEVQRLPDRYRTPFVLCYLEGLTNKQAARQLGCPEGTVMSRLAWARERLRHRLARRGLTLSAGAVTAALLQDAARATVPSVLASTTVRAALAFLAGRAAAAGISAKALALAQGVLQSMFVTKLKVVALAAAMAGAAVTGAQILARPTPPVESEQPPPAKTEPQRPTPSSDAKAKADTGPKAVAVKTVHPQFREKLPVDTNQLATVEAYYRAELGTILATTVKSVRVTLGAPVKKGEELIDFNPPYSPLKAPFDGVISRRTVDPGTFVQPGRTEPLLTVSRVDLVTIVAKFPDNEARYIEPGMEAVIQMGDQPDMQIRTKVSRVAPVISEKDRTLRVEVDLWNGTPKAYKVFLDLENKKPIWERFADLKQRRLPPLPTITGKERFIDGRLLLPGMAGSLTLAVSKFTKIYVVPAAVVFYQDIRYYIFLVEHVQARRVPVVVEANDGKWMKVVTIVDNREHDLTGKETVIVSPPKDLRDGQPVTATPAKDDAPPPKGKPPRE